MMMSDCLHLRMPRYLCVAALATISAIASATAAAAPPIVLPVEVLGPVGSTRSVTVDTASATKTMWLRLHGVAHAASCHGRAHAERIARWSIEWFA